MRSGPGANRSCQHDFGYPRALIPPHVHLVLELGDRQIRHTRETLLRINYRGRQPSSVYRPDLVCFGRVIVEIKALRSLTTREEAQVIHYLKATGFERALRDSCSRRHGEPHRNHRIRRGRDGSIRGFSARDVLAPFILRKSAKSADNPQITQGADLAARRVESADSEMFWPLSFCVIFEVCG